MDKNLTEAVEATDDLRQPWILEIEELPVVATRGSAERNNGTNTRAE